MTTPTPNDQPPPQRETREQIGLRLSFLSTADLRRFMNRTRDADERAVAEQLLARRGSGAAERHASAAGPAGAPIRVVLTDIDMPFSDMVGFMVKWALAAIPAAVILVVIYLVVVALVGGLLAGLFGR